MRRAARDQPIRYPNPRLAFLERWVDRNTPPARTEPRFTACDAGQFMYHGPELTAMMDLELGMLGGSHAGSGDP